MYSGTPAGEEDGGKLGKDLESRISSGKQPTTTRADIPTKTNHHNTGRNTDDEQKPYDGCNNSKGLYSQRNKNITTLQEKNFRLMTTKPDLIHGLRSISRRQAKNAVSVGVDHFTECCHRN